MVRIRANPFFASSERVQVSPSPFPSTARRLKRYGKPLEVRIIIPDSGRILLIRFVLP